MRQVYGCSIEAYCVKCKSKKEIKGEEKITLKNGRKAIKGKCPDCGTGMYRILKIEIIPKVKDFYNRSMITQSIEELSKMEEEYRNLIKELERDIPGSVVNPRMESKYYRILREALVNVREQKRMR